MATMLTNVNLSACRRPVYTTYELSEPGKNDCNMRFSSGLADDPHEKNKGEIVYELSRFPFKRYAHESG